MSFKPQYNPFPTDLTHYVKLVNTTANPTKHLLYTQTAFILTMKSVEFTTTSDFYTMTSDKRTIMSDKFTMASVERTMTSDFCTMASVECTMTSVKRTMNKYLFAFYFNIDNRQLSTDNSPL
jgi:hypothetical protein